MKFVTFKVSVCKKTKEKSPQIRIQREKRIRNFLNTTEIIIFCLKRTQFHVLVPEEMGIYS